MATNAQRQHLHELVEFLRQHASQLDYPPGDQRDNRDAISWRLTEQQAEHVLNSGGRMQLDCSEMGAWLLKSVGCWHLPAPGYTGSHLALLPHYKDPRIARTGALVVFGPGTGDHECVVYEPDPTNGDPLLAGHGRPGFDVERLSVVRARHRSPVTLLSVAHL